MKHPAQHPEELKETGEEIILKETKAELKSPPLTWGWRYTGYSLNRQDEDGKGLDIFHTVEWPLIPDDPAAEKRLQPSVSCITVEDPATSLT